MNEYKMGDKVKLKNGRMGRITAIRFDPETEQISKIEVEQGKEHKVYKIDSVVEHVRSY